MKISQLFTPPITDTTWGTLNLPPPPPQTHTLPRAASSCNRNGRADSNTEPFVQRYQFQRLVDWCREGGRIGARSASCSRCRAVSVVSVMQSRELRVPWRVQARSLTATPASSVHAITLYPAKTLCVTPNLFYVCSNPCGDPIGLLVRLSGSTHEKLEDGYTNFNENSTLGRRTEICWCTRIAVTVLDNGGK
jgi:hypothetical protein